MGEAVRAPTDRAPVVRTAAIAAVVLILAATIMPWATHKDISSGSTTTFRGGALGVVLVVLGLASIALSLATRRGPSIALGRLHLVVGCTALIVCVALALNKISAANNVTATGPSQTAYGYASGVAFIAAATIAFTSLRRMRAS
jgi:peptidoglycan/LPS O-acetylase OafA/YrhL